VSDEKAALEAVLFLAGRPLAAEDLARGAGVPEERVAPLLRSLAQDYRGRASAMEVVKVGRGWALQLRPEVAPSAQALARTELPEEVLRTAALIAYHQPVKQSDLVAMVGSAAYEHVTALARMKLINAAAEGNTLRLTTSVLFPEYFGLPASSPREVKRIMTEKVGRGKGEEPFLSGSHN
jgi:segregation and condensation protein B